jgi:ABC-2 type transport system permease protein
MTLPIRFHGIRRRLARMFAVARVETLHLIHDRTTFSLILLVPAVQIVLFGYAVNLDPRHIPIVIAGNKQGPEHRLSAR